jgi:hypothetical protein
MIIAVCDCLQCAVCGVRCAALLIHVVCAVCAAVCSERCAVCGTLIHVVCAVCAVCAAVCGSEHGSVRQCAAVCGSVRQCVAAWQCGSVQQGGSVHIFK